MKVSPPSSGCASKFIASSWTSLLGGELATYVDIRAAVGTRYSGMPKSPASLRSLLLVWVFGSSRRQSLPLIVGIVTIVLSVALLKTFTLFIDVSVYAANVVSMLGLGLAIDYALFIVSRFREELGGRT
jgi:predicted RND superfamily exporter protein